MNCIICKTPLLTNVPREHIIPEAIGGKLVTRSICNKCNNACGDKIDNLLTDDNLILTLRQHFRIKHNGKYVDITHKGLDIRNVETNEKMKIGINNPFFGGYIGPYLQKDLTPHVEGEVKDGAFIVTSFSGDNPNTIINKADNLSKKCKAVFDKEDFKKRKLDTAPIEYSFYTAINRLHLDARSYSPCFVKIAFEFMHRVYGEGYLSDSTAETTRKYLYYYLHEPEKIDAFLMKNDIPEATFGLTKEYPAIDYSNDRFHYISSFNYNDVKHIKICLFNFVVCYFQVSTNKNMSVSEGIMKDSRFEICEDNQLLFKNYF
jgi:hypothetical protein